MFIIALHFTIYLVYITTHTNVEVLFVIFNQKMYTDTEYHDCYAYNCNIALDVVNRDILFIIEPIEHRSLLYDSI